MTDPYFQIFKRPDDHFKWGNHIEFIKQNPEMDESFRDEVLEAFKSSGSMMFLSES